MFESRLTLRYVISHNIVLTCLVCTHVEKWNSSLEWKKATEREIGDDKRSGLYRMIVGNEAE